MATEPKAKTAKSPTETAKSPTAAKPSPTERLIAAHDSVGMYREKAAGAEVAAGYEYTRAERAEYELAAQSAAFERFKRQQLKEADVPKIPKVVIIVLIVGGLLAAGGIGYFLVSLKHPIIVQADPANAIDSAKLRDEAATAKAMAEAAKVQATEAKAQAAKATQDLAQLQEAFNAAQSATPKADRLAPPATAPAAPAPAAVPQPEGNVPPGWTKRDVELLGVPQATPSPPPTRLTMNGPRGPDQREWSDEEDGQLEEMLARKSEHVLRDVPRSHKHQGYTGRQEGPQPVRPGCAETKVRSGSEMFVRVVCR